MTNNQEKTKKLIPILIIALIIVMIISLISGIFNRAQNIQFIKASITPGLKIGLDQSLSFEFDKEIKQVQIQIKPVAKLTQNIENNKLIISPQESWENFSNYELLIDVEAKNGSSLALPYNFGTYETFEAEGAAQDEALNQTLYPLMPKLPLKTDKYLMYYDHPMTLRVELKYETTRAQVEAEILDWIREMGIDPATHTIVFR